MRAKPQMTRSKAPIASLLMMMSGVFVSIKLSNCNLLEDNGANAGLVLAAKLVFIDNIIKLFYQAFDLP
jgi:hypothetical protein